MKRHPLTSIPGQRRGVEKMESGKRKERLMELFRMQRAWNGILCILQLWMNGT